MDIQFKVTFFQTACPQWKAHPAIVTSGKTALMAFQAAASKSVTARVTLRSSPKISSTCKKKNYHIYK